MQNKILMSLFAVFQFPTTPFHITTWCGTENWSVYPGYENGKHRTQNNFSFFFCSSTTNPPCTFLHLIEIFCETIWQSLIFRITRDIFWNLEMFNFKKNLHLLCIVVSHRMCSPNCCSFHLCMCVGPARLWPASPEVCTAADGPAFSSWLTSFFKVDTWASQVEILFNVSSWTSTFSVLCCSEYFPGGRTM